MIVTHINVTAFHFQLAFDSAAVVLYLFSVCVFLWKNRLSREVFFASKSSFKEKKTLHFLRRFVSIKFVPLPKFQGQIYDTFENSPLKICYKNHTQKFTYTCSIEFISIIIICARTTKEEGGGKA